MNGQKLQGTATTEEVHTFLEARGRTVSCGSSIMVPNHITDALPCPVQTAYPLFNKVYQIAFEGLPAAELTKDLGA